MTTTPGWTTLAACGCCGERAATVVGRPQSTDLLRCRGCGTLRFRAVVTPEVVYRDGYHDGSSEFGWDYTTYAERGYEEATAADRIAWLERHRGPGRLVDVGGGLGFFTAAAAARGWDAELLEPVAQACAYARSRLGVRATEGGADLLSERKGSYDVVSFLHCIEHIPEARDTLRAAGRALRRDGLLFVEVPNHGSIARRLQGERWLGWQAGEHVYVFDRRTLLRCIRAAGFEPVAVRTYVPGWEGLDTHGYAHMLGAEPLLSAAVRLKRRAHGDRSAANRSVAADARSPSAVRDLGGLRRRVLGDGFRLAARAEEALGVGTNLQVLARRRP